MRVRASRESVYPPSKALLWRAGYQGIETTDVPSTSDRSAGRGGKGAHVGSRPGARPAAILCKTERLVRRARRPAAVISKQRLRRPPRTGSGNVYSEETTCSPIRDRSIPLASSRTSVL